MPKSKGREEEMTRPKEARAQTQITPDQWVPLFLEAIAEGNTITRAAWIARVSMTSVYRRRENKPEFKAAWDKAAEIATELLEQEAQRRGYHGVEEPVFHKGEQCGTVRKYSDSMLLAILKARKPEVYRDDRKHTTVNVSIAANQAAVQVLNDVPLDLGMGLISTSNLPSPQGEGEPLDLSMLDTKEPVKVESAPVRQGGTVPKPIEKRGAKKLEE